MILNDLKIYFINILLVKFKNRCVIFYHSGDYEIMKKAIILGCFLAAFLLLITPSVNAIEYNHVEETQKTTICEYVDEIKEKININSYRKQQIPYLKESLEIINIRELKENIHSRIKTTFKSINSPIQELILMLFFMIVLGYLCIVTSPLFILGFIIMVIVDKFVNNLYVYMLLRIVSSLLASPFIICWGLLILVGLSFITTIKDMLTPGMFLNQIHKNISLTYNQ
jgi:hypothetical protein